MRVAIGAIVIRENSLLLVRKRNSWILPGGKIEDGEGDLECLSREIDEELSGTKIRNEVFYGEFEGRTPHRGDILKNRVYFADIDGYLKSGVLKTYEIDRLLLTIKAIYLESKNNGKNGDDIFMLMITAEFRRLNTTIAISCIRTPLQCTSTRRVDLPQNHHLSIGARIHQVRALLHMLRFKKLQIEA